VSRANVSRMKFMGDLHFAAVALTSP